MIGQLITTAYTYDQGRNAINYAFSAEASFNTITGQTYYSGTTPLEVIIRNISSNVHIQNGLNTYTGGTPDQPTINISGLTIDNIYVSGAAQFGTVSATTFYSGTTPLSTIISNLAAYPFIQNGLNIYTGGTPSLPTINLSAATLDNINVSGNAIFNTLSAATISSNTIYVSTISGMSPVNINGVIVENNAITANTIFSGNQNIYDVIFDDPKIASATTMLYVDKNRTDSYYETGSINTPFKTITGAVQSIINGGGSSVVNPHIISVSAGVYDENIVLEDSSLLQLAIHGHKYGTILDNGSNYCMQSTVNNDNLLLFTMSDMLIKSPIILSGENDNTKFGNSGFIFKDCLISGAMNVGNLKTIQFYDSNITYDGYWNFQNSRLFLLGCEFDPALYMVRDSNANKPLGLVETCFSSTGSKLNESFSAITIGSETTSLIICNSSIRQDGAISSSDVFVGTGATLNLHASSVKGDIINSGATNLYWSNVSGSINGTAPFLGFQTSDLLFNASSVPGVNVTEALEYIKITYQQTGTTTPQTFQTIDCIGGGTSTWDYSISSNATITLTGNTTLSVTNSSDGNYGTIEVVQDAVGSRTMALPAGDVVVNGGGGAISLTSNPNAIDVLSYVQKGGKRYWNVGLNYT